MLLPSRTSLCAVAVADAVIVNPLSSRQCSHLKSRKFQLACFVYSCSTWSQVKLYTARSKRNKKMSRCSWRSAEALQQARREQRHIQLKDDKSRFRRQKEIQEWEITGASPFRAKEYKYSSGGGVKGVGEFLRAADLALHLYDRQAHEMLI